MTTVPTGKALWLVALLVVLLAGQRTPTFGQNQSERFWLAGRYDGDRVVIYFDAVKFKGTIPSNARKIVNPVAAAFFNPVELPASFITRFQKTPNAEHFAIGDRYDLLLGNGTTATIRLTTLVGCETDEEVGNDSFIGALGTLEKRDALVFTKDYYAVRRHPEPQNNGTQRTIPVVNLKYAHLDDEPVRFDIETRIADLLSERMKTEATAAEQRLAGDVAPAFRVEPFRVADGTLRYYVLAEWKTGKEPPGSSPYTLAAWMTPLPTLQILAVQKLFSPWGIGAGPDLLNVVDLGGGRTGIIVNVAGLDSTDIRLLEYRDGANLINGMHLLQYIGTGE